MEQKNLEEELSSLIREAAQWRTSEGNNGERLDDTSVERDACLSAIANVITNYVTVEITRRLTVPSEPTPPPPSSKTSKTTAAISPRRPASRPVTLSTSRPLTVSTAPSTPRRAGSATRLNKSSQPTTPLQEYSYSLLKKGPQYHSENRLDRFYPAPRPNETPLENKASRLRRQSTERRRGSTCSQK